MTERALVASGYFSTALMVYGIAAHAWRPDAYWSTAPVYLGLVILMLTPLARVAIACARYVRDGDRVSAALTGAILLMIVASAWTGTR